MNKIPVLTQKLHLNEDEDSSFYRVGPSVGYQLIHGRPRFLTLYKPLWSGPF